MQLFLETALELSRSGAIITDRRNEPCNFRNVIPIACNEIWILELMGFLIICAGAFFGLRVAAREMQNPVTRTTFIVGKFFFLPLFYTNAVFNHTALAFVGTAFAALLAASELKAGQGAHSPELFALRTKGGQRVRKT